MFLIAELAQTGVNSIDFGLFKLVSCFMLIISIELHGFFFRLSLLLLSFIITIFLIILPSLSLPSWRE